MNEWTPEIVLNRLIDAYRVIEVITRNPAPSKKPGSSHPAMNLDPSDRYTGRHLDEIERELKAEKERRTTIASGPISMALEAQRWPIEYVENEEHREILIAYATVRSRDGDWSKYVQRRNRRHPTKRAWVRQKTYERKDKALQRIARMLNNNEISLRISEHCETGHDEAPNACEPAVMGIRAQMAPDAKPRGPSELGNPDIYLMDRPKQHRSRAAKRKREAA